MNLCLNCQSPLYSTVNFCPFCGTGTKPGSSARKPAEAAPTSVPAAAVPSPRVRTEPPAAPVPVPTPAATPVPPAPRAQPAPAPVVPPPVLEEPAAVPVRGGPVPFPVEPERAAPKKGGAGKWVVIALILAGLFFFFKGKPDPNEQACNAAFEQGNKALQTKDVPGARSQALLASGVCTGPARSKAVSLQEAIDAAESTSTTCLRSFRTIDSHLDDHKLGSAREALNQLSSTCSADAQAAEATKKLAVAVAAVQTAQTALREALDAKNLNGAKAAYTQLAALNRENADLAPFKGELEQLTTASTAPVEVVPPASTMPADAAPEPAPVQSPAVVAPVPAQRNGATLNDFLADQARNRTPARKSDVDNGANVKAEMAAGFLRDAEAALSEKKFDAARTYVDSARKMDPNNPRINSLNQQIRDRERQVLQQETTIR